MPGRKVWTRERLSSADVNGYLMDQAVPRFASASVRDAQYPTPEEGAECYVGDSKQPQIYLGGAWRHRGVSPTLAVVGPWTEAAGQFGNADQLITSVSVPYPGYPFRLSVVAHGEIGAVATGTRWDMQVKATGGGASTYVLDRILAPAELTVFQRITSGIATVVHTGTCTVAIHAVRAYGTGLGNVTALNRAFTIVRHPAP